MAINPQNNDPKEPKLCEFSYISMTNPPIPFWGLKMVRKGVSIIYSNFVVGCTNFSIMKFGSLAFFEAKMTKIVILDKKLIVSNDFFRLLEVK